MILAAFQLIPILFKTLLVMAISTGVGLLLRRRPAEERKPAGKEEFEYPTAEEGRPIPVVVGCVEVKSANAVSPILEYRAQEKREGGGWFSHSYVAAYYYYVTIHLGICQANIDGINRIRIADTIVWPTLDDPTSLAADGQTSATIAARECWGGWRREGGVSGTVDIQYGGAAQTLNSYLQGILGSDQPAYRGFTGIILRKVYIGTQRVLKPWALMCKRTNKLTDGTAMWYIAKAPVGSDGDLNAVHWLYELLTSTVIGLGKSTSLIDSTTFQAGADTCYTEGYGISGLWDSPGDNVDNIVQEIEQIIDGKIYIDPSTGKFELGLVRDDYDPGSLESYDEEDFWVETMATSSPGEIPSRTVVTWHDRIYGKDRPAVEPDIALLERQGGRSIIQDFDYSAWVKSESLANTIAAREQQAMSAMPKRFTLHSLRSMAHLHETSVIKITYPALSIVTMIVRVVTIDRGALTNGECVLEVVEDVFGTAYTTYGTPPAEGASTASEDLEPRYIEDGVICEAAGTVTSIESGPYIPIIDVDVSDGIGVAGSESVSVS